MMGNERICVKQESREKPKGKRNKQKSRRKKDKIKFGLAHNF